MKCGRYAIFGPPPPPAGTGGTERRAGNRGEGGLGDRPPGGKPRGQGTGRDLREQSATPRGRWWWWADGGVSKPKDQQM